MRSGHAWWGLALGIGVAACGVSVDDFPDRIASTYCERVFACCTQEELADAGTFGTTRDQCRERVRTNYNHATLFKEEEAKGRLTWHADLASTCVSKVSALSCQDLKVPKTATPAECTQYLEPHVAPGSACATAESCVGGGACANPPDAGTSGPVCVPLAKLGDRCDFSGCEAGLYCAGTCTTKKTDGAGCANNYECASGGCNDRNPDGGIGACGLMGGNGTTCFVTKGCSSAGADLAGLALLVVLAGLGRRGAPRR